MRIEVLLPEPFGPSSPVIPLPMLNVASFRASTEPYDLESLSAVRSGADESVANAVPRVA